MSIGEKIKNLRKEKGLTQRDLGKVTNFSHSYIGDLERNRTNPSIKTLETIANYFEVKIPYFFEDECCYRKLLKGIENFCNCNEDEIKSCPIKKLNPKSLLKKDIEGR